MDNNSVVPIFIAGTLIVVLTSCFLIAFLVVHKQRQNAYETQIFITRIEVQENVMIGISKEIHDNIGQLLGLIHMNIKASSDLCTEERRIRLLENANKLLEQAITDCRNISHSLNSEIIKKMGFITLLKNELEYIRLSQNISCNFEVVGEPFDLTSEKELLIYRIAQEAMHNALKYAEASLISITLVYEKGKKFVLSVVDNGIGFDKNKILQVGGIGFINMQQRAQLLEGELNIQSSPSNGCEIILTIYNE